jgi:hypothetical protein
MVVMGDLRQGRQDAKEKLVSADSRALSRGDILHSAFVSAFTVFSWRSWRLGGLGAFFDSRYSGSPKNSEPAYSASIPLAHLRRLTPALGIVFCHLVPTQARDALLALLFEERVGLRIIQRGPGGAAVGILYWFHASFLFIGPDSYSRLAILTRVSWEENGQKAAGPFAGPAVRV